MYEDQRQQIPLLPTFQDPHIKNAYGDRFRQSMAGLGHDDAPRPHKKARLSATVSADAILDIRAHLINEIHELLNMQGSDEFVSVSESSVYVND